MANSSVDKKSWNYSPNEPIRYNPLFEWPIDVAKTFRWIVFRWISISRALFIAILAVGTYHYLTPSLEAFQEPSTEIIALTYVRNSAILFLVAGSLHMYLYSLRMQGDDFKFLKRKMAQKNKFFSFNDQVYDNIFWSLVSGVTVWTAYEILYLNLLANGLISVMPLNDHPLQFFAWLLVLPMVRSGHFYFIHRLLHHPFLYKHVHSTHHRNVHTGPWSGISMHPIENLIYQSSVLIHFVIPSEPAIVFVHLFMTSLGPAFSHSGFEKILAKKTKLLDSADFHHQLHHRYFECNYGTMEVPLDVWFGTDHDGTKEATNRVRLKVRKKSL